MYKIIGGDGQIYGPVSADTLREWIAGRRATANTQVQVEGVTEWKKLGDIPEFAALFANPLPPPPGAAAPPLFVTTPAQTSGLAIASLVCGILGCIPLAALAGLGLGIGALSSINKSQGRLKGRGLAIAGICVSAVMCLFMLPAIFLPALGKARTRAQTIQCGNKMKDLAAAAKTYAQKSGKLPDASNWCDTLKPHLKNQDAFYCPRADSQLCAYGFNAALSGRSLDEVNSSTVMFFEIPGGWNVSGGPEQMLQDPRHLQTYNVVYADGTWKQLTRSAAENLRWDP
jgi:hypothetical protein